MPSLASLPVCAGPPSPAIEWRGDPTINSNETTLSAQKVKFVSPFGTAQYPHISKPDTVGKFADNKFKTKLVMPAGDPGAQTFKQQIIAAAKEIHGAKGDKMYMPFVEDDDANTITFIFKTQYEPTVFDGRNNAINLKKVRIGNGSTLRILGSFVEFEKGISAQFNQVQVKELNGAGSSGFDAIEDGYEYDAAEHADDDSSSSDDSDDSTPNSGLDI